VTVTRRCEETRSLCASHTVVSRYRINATRGLAGGKRVLPPAAVLAQASE